MKYAIEHVKYMENIPEPVKVYYEAIVKAARDQAIARAREQSVPGHTSALERWQIVRDLRAKDCTLRQIGDVLGVTRERARQISKLTKTEILAPAWIFHRGDGICSLITVPGF